MAEDWLENQVEQTAYLVRSARAFDACAASAFGAGFGGAVWAVVPSDRAEHFAERWCANYRREYPEQAELADVFVDRPSAAASWPHGAIRGID
jgi:galactokinase